MAEDPEEVETPPAEPEPASEPVEVQTEPLFGTDPDTTKHSYNPGKTERR
jgi:hypothetical protein